MTENSNARRPPGWPRILILVSHDIYVRQLFLSGALTGILGPETYVVASSGKTRDPKSLEVLAAQPNFLGTVLDPRPTAERPPKRSGGKKYRLFTFDYPFLQELRTVQLRTRSHLIALTARLLARKRQRFFRIAALPGLRQLCHRIVMWRTGRHRTITELMARVRPDIALLVTGGVDSLCADATRSARSLGIPSLALVPNWDALSGGAAFAVRPDHLGVWGHQSAEDAQTLHGFNPKQVHILGSPGFEPYYRYRAKERSSPFPFEYVLFVGGQVPFDEYALIERFEEIIQVRANGLKVVYRPHPDRAKRRAPDFVDESNFRHIVIDPQVRDVYIRHFDVYRPGGTRPKVLPPPLDYYPPLLSHAKFVVSTLSTMLLEAALLGRQTLVTAYHDESNKWSAAELRQAELFKGLDTIDGIEFCDSEAALVDRFESLLQRDDHSYSACRPELRYYVHFDDRSYADRLLPVIHQVAADRHG